MHRGAWRATVRGATKSRTRLSTHTHTHTSVSRPVRWRVVRSAAQLGAGSRWCLGSDGEVCCERTLGCGCSGLRSEYRSLPWAFLIWSLESARVAGARFQKERSLPHNTHFEPRKHTDLKDFFFLKEAQAGFTSLTAVREVMNEQAESVADSV